MNNLANTPLIIGNVWLVGSNLAHDTTIQLIMFVAGVLFLVMGVVVSYFN